MNRKRPNIATSCPMMEYKRPRPGRYPNLNVVKVGAASDLLRVVGEVFEVSSLSLLCKGMGGAGASKCRRVSSKARSSESGIGAGFCGEDTGTDTDVGVRSTFGCKAGFSGVSTSSPTCFRRSSITDDRKSGLSGFNELTNSFAESVWEEPSGDDPFDGWPLFGVARKSGIMPSKIFLRNSSMGGRSETSEEGGSKDALASFCCAPRKTEWMICIPISGQLSFSGSMESGAFFGGMPFAPFCVALSVEASVPCCISLAPRKTALVSDATSGFNSFEDFCAASGDCGSSILSPRERKAIIHCTRKSGFFSLRRRAPFATAGNELVKRVIGGETLSGCGTAVGHLTQR